MATPVHDERHPSGSVNVWIYIDRFSRFIMNCCSRVTKMINRMQGITTNVERYGSYFCARYYALYVERYSSTWIIIQVIEFWMELFVADYFYVLVVLLVKHTKVQTDYSTVFERKKICWWKSYLKHTEYIFQRWKIVPLDPRTIFVRNLWTICGVYSSRICQHPTSSRWNSSLTAKFDLAECASNDIPSDFKFELVDQCIDDFIESSDSICAPRIQPRVDQKGIVYGPIPNWKRLQNCW